MTLPHPGHCLGRGTSIWIPPRFHSGWYDHPRQSPRSSRKGRVISTLPQEICWWLGPETATTIWGTSTCAYGRETRASGKRSEEHTSELQSLTNLVCRLLLEKK